MEHNCRLTAIGFWICLVLLLVVGEAAAQIRISESSLTIDEGGEGSYKVHLDARPSTETTLDIATANSDVRVRPTSLTFTPDDWDRARIVTVEAIQDADAEDERATVSHSVRASSNRRGGAANARAATAKAFSSLTVTVLDRSVPSHEVNVIPSSGLSIRKGKSGNYSVSLTEEPTASVTVWASSSRSDVRVSPSSRTFFVGTWNSAQSFTVSVDADATSTGATISHSATSGDFNYQGLTIDSLPVTVLQPPAGITQPPSHTRVLVGQTKTLYSPRLRSQPRGNVTVNASSQAAVTATVTGSKSFSTGNWSTAQDFKVTGKRVGTTTITYDVNSSDSRYDGYDLNSTSVTVEATTITCGADDTNIQLGGSTTLSWNSTNADSVTIDQGVGSVPVDSPRGGKSVTPPQPGAAETSRSTSYRFTASGAGNPGTCNVAITVWRPPNVSRFSAGPATLRKQQSTNLTWATSHASAASINQGIGTVPLDSSEGGRSVTPAQPSTAETSRETSYGLTASNPGYTGANAATATVSVTVWSRPSVDSFTASPSTINEGQDSSLKWTTTHATNVSIDQGVGSVSVDDESGNTKVSPDQDTTYTLTASNTGYSGAHAAMDTVRVSVSRVTAPQPPAGITRPPSHTRVLVGQTKTFYSPRLRSQPRGNVTVNASSQAAGTATVTGSKSFSTGNWSTAQDFKVTGKRVGTTTITYDVNSSDSRYDGYDLNSTSVTVEATTITCGADDTNIQLGGSTTLSWNSTNADSVTIDQGVGSVPVDSPRGGKSVTPPQPGAAETSRSTSYRFTASGAGNPGTCNVAITVWRPPNVSRFSAGPATLRKQQSTNLTWATSHASAASINQGIGTVPLDSSEGGRSVTPAQPSTAETSRETSYGLTASNPGYTGANAATATVSVTVWSRPSVDSFTASPSTINEGQDSSLKWTTTHATNVSIDQGVGSVSVDDESGNTKVSPDQDTTYTLTASNAGYGGARAVSDTVRVTLNVPISPQPPTPGLTVSPTTLDLIEGTAGESYSVRLKTRPNSDVTVAVDIESGGDSRVQTDTSSLTFTPTDWNRDQAVQVFAEEQSGTATGQARITNTPSLSYGGSAVGVTVDVIDDDTDGCGATVTPTRLTIDEGESNDGYYDVVLATKPAASVTITLDLAGDPSLSADRRYLTFTTENWNISQRVTIEAGEDDDASDRRVTIAHTASSTDEGCSDMSISSVSVNIRDHDEPPPLPAITLSSDGSSVSEPDGTATVTASVASGEEPVDDLTVNLTHSGRAANGTDYTVATLTINSGATSGEAELTVVDDSVVEGTEGIRLIAGADGYRDSAPLSMDLADDDSAGVSIAPTQLTFAEGSSANYDVVLTSQPTHAVTVTITRNGDADISLDDQELTFSDSDWNQAQTVTVSAAQDDDALDDTATFSHTVTSTDSDYHGITVPEVNVTATDDKPASVSITPTLLTISEGGSDSYQVVLTSQPSHDVTITITHSGDMDVGIGAGSLTFTATNWNEPQAVRVEASPDDDAVNDTATLVHSSASSDGAYDGLPLSDVRISVGDDDLAGVSITPTTLSIPEGGSRTYTVVLKSRPANTVYLAVSSDNRDLNPSPGALTFAPRDWNAPQTVRARVAHDDDALDEKARFSHVAASADWTYQGISVNDVVIGVSDDDSAGVKVTPTRLEVPEDASTTYTVALTSRPSQPVVVAVSHSGDPDISADVARVSFVPSEWESPSTVTVQASRDPDALDDTATLKHSASSSDSTYDGVPVDPVRITVSDLDSAGVVISPLNLTIEEGASRTYTVVLTSKPSRDVVVEVERRGDQDVVPQPDSLTFDDSDWNEPQTVSVQTLQDPDAVNDTAILAHSAASSDTSYGGLAVPDVSVSVIDDDSTGVSVSPQELSIQEGDSETFTVVLTSKPSAEVHLSLRSNNSDISTLPVSLTFSPATWSTTQEVSVTVSQDDDATDEVGTLTFSATSPDSTYHGIPVPAVSVDVTDDDNAGVKVVPNPHMSVPEGESATYTVVLLSQPMATVTVSILSSNPQILTAIMDQVTFTQDNWNIAQAVAFDTFYDDNTLDENELFSHSAKSYDPNYKSISVTPLRVTVTDRTAEELTHTLPVLMSAMSGALAESIQTAVESRFERRRQLQRMKQEQGWWMPTYYQDRSRHSPEFDPSGGPETGPILSRASFGLPLAGNSFAGSYWRPVLWGHGDFQHFNGNSSQIEFRGGLGATHVGMDFLSNRQLLTGLSFARSWGSMRYGDSREGQLASGFNTIHPYLHWQPHRRLSFWGIGGVGRGSVDIRDRQLVHVFNAEFRMWAGGLRSLLTRPGNNEVGLRVDGFTSNIGIDPFERIGEVYGKASRARAMLEVIHQRGGRKRSFSLKSEIGGRLDRGEAVHGTSMETGLRLGFIDSPTGLDLALQGRMLLFHDGGYQDWGAGLQASWDPGNKRRGLRMSALASHGQNGQGGAALWDNSHAYSRGQGRGLTLSPVPVSRIDSEAAYGLEVLQGRGLLTPFSRLRWTGHGKQWSVGSEFGLQPATSDTNPLNLELEGTRGKSSRGADMGLRIRMSIPF